MTTATATNTAATFAQIAKLQRDLAILKAGLLDSGNLEAASQLADFLSSEAETLVEEIECYEAE